MSKSWLWVAGGVLLIALAAIGLSSGLFGQRQAADATIVRIGTFSTGIDYAPYYVAKSQGWLDEAAQRHNATIEYTSFEALPAINDALGAGRLDIILQADTPAIIQEVAGNNLIELVPLASMARQLVVAEQSSITHLTDLRGRRIALLFGTGFHYGLVDTLDHAGVPQSAYTLVSLAPPQAQAALTAGTIDAWAMWPPFPQQAAINGLGRLIPLGEGRFISFAFASQTFVDEHQALVADIAAAIERGREFIRNSPAEAQALVVTETGLSQEVVAMAWETMKFQFQFDTNAVRDIQAQATFLHEGEYVTREVNVQAEIFESEQDAP